MCAIYGILEKAHQHFRASSINQFELISHRARARGRDAGNTMSTRVGPCDARFGWWRATPTPEVAQCKLQPYYDQDFNRFVFHNGTIANDKELGGMPGEVDSQVLPRVLDLTSLTTLTESLSRVRGSYALACGNRDAFYLAANYKPLYYVQVDGAFAYASLEEFLEPMTVGLHVAPVKLQPYSVLNVITGEKASFAPQQSARKVVVVCSAGLDSTAVASIYKAQGAEVTLLHFTYGCKAENREVSLVKQIGEWLGCEVAIVALPRQTVCGGSLTEAGLEISGGIAGAEYAHEWVPARNFQMLALAAGYAEAHGIGTVAYGGNLEESGAYPDNELELINLLNKAAPNIVADGKPLTFEAPLGHLMKHEIIRAGLEAGAPFHLTWSCYRGGATQCGQCGPCFMRQRAFHRNGVTDPAAFQQPLPREEAA